MSQDLTRRSLSGLIAAMTATGWAHATELAVPLQPTLLTISGRIGIHNDGNTARFDRAMIEALGMQGFATATPWYKEVARFDGVLMRTLLRSVKASGETATAVALNDYATEIPMSDFEQYDVLLALKRDGEYMPVRDKGPLFVVYPFDSDTRLQNRRYYSRSAWQLNQLIIR